MPDLIDRLVAKIEFTDSGCWEWRNATRTGYGVIRVGSQKDGTRRMEPAHRSLWEAVVEQIPAGMEVDHLCKNHSCVNPDHLEPVTPRENKLRSDSFVGVNARKANCANGHPFDGGNTHIDYRGRRKCRTCGREQKRARDARRRLARADRIGGTDA